MFYRSLHLVPNGYVCIILCLSVMIVVEFHRREDLYIQTNILKGFFDILQVNIVESRQKLETLLLTKT